MVGVERIMHTLRDLLKVIANHLTDGFTGRVLLYLLYEHELITLSDLRNVTDAVEQRLEDKIENGEALTKHEKWITGR